MTRHDLSIMLCALGTALLLACASPGPVTLTCSALGIARAAEAGQRIDLGDFSVTAPKGEGWCVASKKWSEVVFVTHPLMGRLIEKPSLGMTRNTVALTATKIKHGAETLDRPGELERFVGKWIKGGMGIDSSGPVPVISDALDPRFTPVQSEVRLSPLSGVDCVHFESLVEERDNPIAPGSVLILTIDGAVCRHVNAPEYLVHLSLSERYEQGRQIDPSLFSRLKGQVAEPFFDSLRFPPTS